MIAFLLALLALFSGTGAAITGPATPQTQTITAPMPDSAHALAG